MKANNTSQGLIIHASYSGAPYMAPEAVVEFFKLDYLTTKEGKRIGKTKATNIVLGQIKKGILPSEKIGRYRLVNMMALVQQALEAEFFEDVEAEASKTKTLH